MPWLSIIMAVLTFFLSGGAKKENRGRAALLAAGAGLGTYYVTHHTDWGQENLGRWDGVDIGINPNGNPEIGNGPSKPAIPIPGGNVADSGSGGFWNTIGGWLRSPAGQVTTGVAGASILGLPNWVVWGGALVGVYILLKD